MKRELLIVLAEELGEMAVQCLEAQKRASKIIRFEHLMDEEGVEANVRKLQEELNDVISMVVALRNEGLHLEINDTHIEEKIQRVVGYIPRK